jgi:hypothetical protein
MSSSLGATTLCEFWQVQQFLKFFLEHFLCISLHGCVDGLSHYHLVWLLCFDLPSKADPASSYPTTGIALKVIGTRKPQRHVKG